MTSESSLFSHRWLPLFLVAPFMLLIVLFFYAPIFQAFYWSFFLERPFGGGSMFVGSENFVRVLSDPEFWEAGWRTIVFMITGSSLAVLIPLILAVAADRKIRLSLPARNVLVWPKGVAGASIGVVFAFLFNPFVGVLAPLNSIVPGIWAPGIDGTDAFITLIAAHVWGGIPFNFVILLAGLQSIPRTMHQAAAMDGAGPWRRILDVQLPLIAPQLFLTLVLEFTESVTSAFALIDTITKGGPGGSTTLLVYKIYTDGFSGYDLSGASTQTAILMVFVVLLTAAQFLFLGRRINYER
ncbi:UNVERIFIED_ORG: sn-glycerol 3-phosphate transport system permease protein [Rhizobium etli]|uniref:carbohydrate ABC transporter permease n=1 Tax=Rhizobium TaxID=379 RepID=UPI0009901402|nr:MULTISPECIES: sugar ABC transporter permease [Rhizobium]ARQ58867.1 sn-glycerol-3-phosphate ABC transporter permease protein UgpA 1 [Rhizobium sp. Kim5]PCK85458.1 sugar ABC transporter permease [Rhizobium sophoriradicis]RSC01400.1 sugar ABC transporter permease [Rhizobium sophoriradicis]